MVEVVEQHWSRGPHYQLSDAITFITWRLAFTLPKHLIELFQELTNAATDTGKKTDRERLNQHNAYILGKFWEYDQGLGDFRQPGFSLNDSLIAEIVTGAFRYFDGTKYVLHAFCVMSNHIHLVIAARKNEQGAYFLMSNIVQSLKRFTANQINKTLGKGGQIWDDYYFDRIIRDYDDYRNVINYTLNNPVKAGLVDDSSKWKDSYFNPLLVQG